MSSVLFSRGQNFQTGANRKVEDVMRDMELLKVTAAQNKELLSECSRVVTVLETKISSLQSIVSGLQAKVKDLETPKGKSKGAIPLE